MALCPRVKCSDALALTALGHHSQGSAATAEFRLNVSPPVSTTVAGHQTTPLSLRPRSPTSQRSNYPHQSK